MWSSSRFASAVTWHRPFFLSSAICCRVATSSVFSPKPPLCLHEDCSEFLRWLQQKASSEISSYLSLGASIHGRSLFASRFIQAGDCILKVPFSAQITPDNIHPDIAFFLGDDIGNIARLALIVLAEQKKGRDSEWAPYIFSLPQMGELNSTIFWNEEEMEMVRQSPIYHETLNHKAFIEKKFSIVRLVMERYAQMFEHIKLESFMHAYALVASRAWGAPNGLSLVPFADFLNHDGVSETVLLADEDKKISEAISHKNYASGDEVFICYGKYSNATLLLDFGFTLSNNIYDQVQIWMVVSYKDPLHQMKVKLLNQHHIRTVKEFDCFRSSFTIREVRYSRGKGRGIPQSLRAFTRVLATTSLEELRDLEVEAIECDGRLARRPLKDKSKEIEAHQLLLLELTSVIQKYEASMKSLGSNSSLFINDQLSLRRQMARDLLTGELRVLKSASAWLVNYCASLSS